MSSSQQLSTSAASEDDQLSELEATLYTLASKVNSHLADSHPELSTSQRGKIVAAELESAFSSVDSSIGDSQPSETKWKGWGRTKHF